MMFNSVSLFIRARSSMIGMRSISLQNPLTALASRFLKTTFTSPVKIKTPESYCLTMLDESDERIKELYKGFQEKLDKIK